MLEQSVNRDLVIMEAVAETLRRREPLEKGSRVAMIKDKRSFILMDTRKDGTALISHCSRKGKVTTKICALDDLFNLDTASAIALRMIIVGEKPQNFLLG